MRRKKDLKGKEDKDKDKTGKSGRRCTETRVYLVWYYTDELALIRINTAMPES